MSHETLVLAAKVFGPIWMGGFLLIVLIRSYNPRRRAEQERIARSILSSETAEERR
ncbi:MAG TPA: CcoQ/FixQ family Cbb3-type cytochrome c oxidase assembly chaperone [Amaricoccus sp.]|uniref:cbb3-type cytochrome oxidase subunit 3 n=1 Tax=Amaricoccus sp. TaxID=1872485 RepID=UPI002D13051C|nr:CcoQ/FixQ family Cbb3-type cytochrome c oxidase assembly chaperone [Amaricoccus sp.]HMQ93699.1 CcoQ/FixQ family Cbb3-type cytochrome c oxidase assembly chaperone [Amaricoccus sp.]HMR52816.1 CcoQ/FixQ family Cbb3-type cytochrome c oxidase assembly chaperone [Amaricoccus sp.]HMR60246.1 CcoQ/FixQ family Cbb3-type cytochrome c oxidase assembly chaperone [Amaricoccus sp.]HMT99751.1 CcoQ/FixQ family Cbb3-type cytochrome c oxidase assembly chaperone [Amaricoccus sp.]